VETAHGVIAHYHDLVVKGTMTESEAKQAAIATIKPLRYSGTEYFFIQDYQVKMVMHPINAKLDGQDVSGLKDASGKLMTAEMDKMAKANGSGFVFYMWPKPGSETPVDKVSYVKAFEPWGWIIASGVYVDNVDAVIATRFIKGGFGAAVLAGLLLLVSLLISRGLLRQLGGEPDVASDITRRIAAGDLTVAMELRRMTSPVCCMPSRPCETACPALWVRSGRVQKVSPAPVPKLPKATTTCQRAPNTRPARWSKLPPAWKSSTPPSSKTQKQPSKPTSWRKVPARSPSRVARWWHRWWTP